MSSRRQPPRKRAATPRRPKAAIPPTPPMPKTVPMRRPPRPRGGLSIVPDTPPTPLGPTDPPRPPLPDIEEGRALTSPADLVDRKEDQALALRIRGGLTYDQIARELGYDGRGGAYKACQRAMERSPLEPVEEIKQLELLRLEHLQGAAWPLAMAGDPQAIESALRIATRRSRILGLDAPRKIETSGDAQQQLHDAQITMVIAAMTAFAAALGHDAKSNEVKTVMIQALEAVGSDEQHAIGD